MASSEEVSRIWGDGPTSERKDYHEPMPLARMGSQVIRYLRRRNYWRYRRLCHDFLWMQKQLKGMGLNPEDARLYVGYLTEEGWRRKDGRL